MLFKKVLMPAILYTLYMVTVSTSFAVILGFISAVILIINGPKGLRPNSLIYKSLNLVINVLRSFTFIILMISIFPLTKFIVGTTIGTNAAIVLGVTLTVINIIGYSAMAGTIGGGGLGYVAVKYGYFEPSLHLKY
jgi:D-methionine transport system permease protein